jgi:hypothetical protein
LVRRQFVERRLHKGADVSWHFGSVDQLQDFVQQTNCSFDTLFGRPD